MQLKKRRAAALWKFFGALLVALTICSAGASAANNPGVSAAQCLHVETGNGKANFSNLCDQQIFVIYCGELKYSNKRCGDGPNGGFYTHSFNLQPGQSRDEDIVGQFNWGSCVGSIGFGNGGAYTDSPDGGFTCLKR